MGTYGFIRFSLPLLPADAVMRARIIHIVIVLSLIGIIYGALVCLMQKDMKRLIAYSSVSHLGFCTLGIFSRLRRMAWRAVCSSRSTTASPPARCS